MSAVLGLVIILDIQDAINGADDCDTIYVFCGTYFENIVIDKKINLVGEFNQNTIIDGSRKGDTVNIKVDGVKIQDFTIKNGSSNISVDWFRAGVRVTGSNVSIQGNIFCDNLLGIFGKRVTDISICNNIFLNDGITFSSYDSELKHPPLYEKYFIHKIENNTVNGKPLLYYKNQENFAVPSNVGQLIAVNCSKMIISNASITNTDFGIILAFCRFCTIEKSNLSSNDEMIWLIRSDYNIIEFNNISNNFHGICIDYGSKNNIIRNNHISKNQWCGIILEYFSSNNIIENNNLLKNNVKNGYFIQSFRNKWSGNYWDDWIGLNNGILGRLPKIIWGQPLERVVHSFWFNFDLHPAQKPFDIF